VSLESGFIQALKEANLVAFYSPRICAATEKMMGIEIVAGVNPAGMQWRPLQWDTDLSSADAEQFWIWLQKEMQTHLGLLKRHPLSTELRSLGLFISMPVFSLQLESEDWAVRTVKFINELSAFGIVLEIEIIQCKDVFNSTVAEWSFDMIRQAGGKLILGNFPTNALSFACLGRHKFDKVKIAKAMLPTMTDAVSNWATQREVIKGLVSTIKGLGAEAILAGIEREAHLNFFRELEVVQWQGGHWPAMDFISMIEKFGLQAGRAVPQLSRLVWPASK
jgi:EAL domain-containing protein (putative c-di-GMP-specific phosphodiesterase class I)